MTETKPPAPVREWQVVSTTCQEPPRLSWFRINAVQVRDTLNTRDVGRYKIERITKENQ